jgi:hypothetical protein
VIAIIMSIIFSFEAYRTEIKSEYIRDEGMDNDDKKYAVISGLILSVLTLPAIPIFLKCLLSKLRIEKIEQNQYEGGDAEADGAGEEDYYT